MSTETTKLHENTERKHGWLSILLQLLFAFTVIGCAVALSMYYLNSPPKPKPRTRQPIAPLVTVTPFQTRDVQYQFDAMGVVDSAKQIQLASQVSGEIIAMGEEFLPGGYFSTGDQLVTIDPTEYKLALMELESSLAKVQSDLNLEMGSQRIALKEFEILGEDVSETEKQLMLRMPQLETARANVAAARAQLEKAQLDLARTKIRAPFNGVVLSRSVNIGSRVSTSTALAQIAGTDQFWIKTSVPVDKLQWLDIPQSGKEAGSPAKVFLDDTNNTNHRSGTIIRLAPDLEEQGRMAVIYVAVDDPLCLLPKNQEKPKLLIGSFVRVRFTGRTLSSVSVVHRDHLHEDNSLWILTDDNRLAIETAKIVAKTKEYVYIDGAGTKDKKLITSAVTSPAPGTPLRTADMKQKGDNSRQQARPEGAEKSE